MAKLTPQTEEDRKGRDYSIPAGRYVIGAEEFERKHPKEAGKHDFIKVKWFVVGPGSRGKRTYMTASCDLSKEGTRFRWQLWAEALALVELFNQVGWPELGDAIEGMATCAEGDRNIGRYFMGRAIVAEVGREQSNGYWNNDIKKYVPRDKWGEKEAQAVQTWESEFRKQAEQKVDPEDYVDQGDDGPPPDDADFEAPADEDDGALGW